jgi:hypothetical protein
MNARENFGKLEISLFRGDVAIDMANLDLSLWGWGLGVFVNDSVYRHRNKGTLSSTGPFLGGYVNTKKRYPGPVVFSFMMTFVPRTDDGLTHRFFLWYVNRDTVDVCRRGLSLGVPRNHPQRDRIEVCHVRIPPQFW